jgi:hypothetical protein
MTPKNVSPKNENEIWVSKNEKFDADFESVEKVAKKIYVKK